MHLKVCRSTIHQMVKCMQLIDVSYGSANQPVALILVKILDLQMVHPHCPNIKHAYLLARTRLLIPQMGVAVQRKTRMKSER
ncbi:MAG: hypothetical protein D8M59_01640 [Planctomycetes bacterium]|nr:hypothetical protein [Planctomycetota bacterium]